MDTISLYGQGKRVGIVKEESPDVGKRRISEYQMCFMTSPDGINWVKHIESEHKSAIFVGSGDLDGGTTICKLKWVEE